MNQSFFAFQLPKFVTILILLYSRTPLQQLRNQNHIYQLWRLKRSLKRCKISMINAKLISFSDHINKMISNLNHISFVQKALLMKNEIIKSLTETQGSCVGHYLNFGKNDYCEQRIFGYTRNSKYNYLSYSPSAATGTARTTAPTATTTTATATATATAATTTTAATTATT